MLLFKSRNNIRLESNTVITYDIPSINSVDHNLGFINIRLFWLVDLAL